MMMTMMMMMAVVMIRMRMSMMIRMMIWCSSSAAAVVVVTVSMALGRSAEPQNVTMLSHVTHKLRSQKYKECLVRTICWYVIMAANLVRNYNIMQKNPGKNNMTYKSTNWFKKDLQETMVNTCSYHKFNKGFL